LREIESSESELGIACFAQGTAGFEDLDLHGVIGALETSE